MRSARYRSDQRQFPGVPTLIEKPARSLFAQFASLECDWPLLIHDSPYFAITDTDGKFTIKNFPVGEWEFRVWQEAVGYINAKSDWKKGVFTMTIKAGENDLGTLKLDLTMFKK